MTRDRLNRLVVRKDTRHYITNSGQLIEGPLDGRYELPLPVETSWATERLGNGEEYECFLCGGTFETLARLNKHLESPRHADKIHRCPKPDCRAEFRTLGGLCQHVEGGTCGVRTLRRVPGRNVMDSLTRGFNALAT
jgi:hypothetical protein